MGFIKKMIQVFLCVIAGNTICSAIFVTWIEPSLNIDNNHLWQIIIVAATCALGNFIFYSRTELCKRQNIIRLAIHYCYINIVVIGATILFQWVNPKHSWNVVVMIVFVAAIYALVTLVTLSNDRKEAERMNSKLQQMNHRDAV